MTSSSRSIPRCATKSAAACPRPAPTRTASRTDRQVTESRSFITHLECGGTSERVPANILHGLSPAGRPLLVRYDLEAARSGLTAATLAARPADMWRWREILPIRDAADIVSLGETETPLVALPRTAARAGADPAALIVKDEGRLPTGSFKARGVAMAVSMAASLGVRRIAMPTNGNAAAALAAYGARAGMEIDLFCPDDTPAVNLGEMAIHGARVHVADGKIDECGGLVGKGAAAGLWFDCSTRKE